MDNGSQQSPDRGAQDLSIRHESKADEPKNNHSVIVRVNDRGPFVKGHELALPAGLQGVLGLCGPA